MCLHHCCLYDARRSHRDCGFNKAEVKTAQAVQQGLDVRVTMSDDNSLLDSSLLDKKKKTGSGKDTEGSDLDLGSPRKDGSPMDKKLDKEIRQKNEDQERAKTPPPHIPALKEGESVIGGITHPPSPHSPGALQSQKRCRM